MQRMIDACPIHPRNETGLGEWYDRHKARASLALRSASCAIEVNIEEGGLTPSMDRFFTLNSSDLLGQIRSPDGAHAGGTAL